VIDDTDGEDVLGRLGDARRAAGDDGVGVLTVAAGAVDTDRLIEHGADEVVVVKTACTGQRTKVAAAAEVLCPHHPRLVLAPGTAGGREWAARLAIRAGWRLISPGLIVRRRSDGLEVTALDRTGRLSRRLTVGDHETAVVTLRPGVAEAIVADTRRRGIVRTVSFDPLDEPVAERQIIPADPATVDIRFASRLVAGGRGLGRREGFAALAALAEKLGAGVAASRVAVDLGWIDRERQVGQTGKTVTPDLYIACGISGASHHLDGMSDAKHIVAINTDPDAPIFKVAALGLVADLHTVLKHTLEALDPCAR
jgi:electron transfer flavoprotein alpha subunit